jgi:exosortase
MADNFTASTTDTQETVSTPKEQWQQLGVHTYIRIAIVGVLLYWLFQKEVGGIVYQWLTDPGWSHGLIIPLFSLYFLNLPKPEILNTRTKPNYLGLLLLVGVILFYIFNTISPAGYGYFRQISAVGALLAVVLFLCGWPLLKYTWFPVVYLIFAVPLPDYVMKPITIPMRIYAAGASSAILNLFPNLDATANGVIIDIVYKGTPLNPPLDVAEACSGMRLLMTFVALGAAMAYLHYWSTRRRLESLASKMQIDWRILWVAERRILWPTELVLLASTVPIAFLCNILRVIITGFIYVLGDPQYAQGIYHDLLGMTMLLPAFGLYGGIAWFMSNLFVESDETKVSDVIVRRK